MYSKEKMKYIKDNSLTIGSKIYITCTKCDKFIRINKPIFGSLHICIDESEGED